MDRQRARTCPPGGDPGGTGAAGAGSAPHPRVPWRASGFRGTRSEFPVGRRSGILLLAVLVLGVASTPGSATAAPAGGTVAVASTTGAPALVLDYQTPWVTPGQRFDLHLRAAASGVPTARLGITVSVFACLSSISGFDQSTSSSQLGTPVSSTPSPLPVSSLPALPGDAVDLSMAVVVGALVPAASTPAPAFTIHLRSVTGQCQSYPAGVFPVRVQLVDTSDAGVLGSFTTHLIFSEARTDTQRLGAAVVLPIQITQGASRAPTPAALLARPSAALATPPEATIHALTDTVANLAVQHPSVPVTLQVSGQTVGLLDTPAHQATVTQLGELAATSEVHQFTSAPFTPVDATSLVDAGLGGELSLQVARGTQVVDAATGRAPPALATSRPWITGGGLDAATVGALVATGFDQVVLPASQLSATPADGSSTTAPFTLTGSRGTQATAMASDDDLTARFTADPGNPVLAAHQLVAELAQLYYELPNDISPRAVVAVAPSGWNDDPVFVDALLGSLEENPVIQAVTTSQLFSLFPTPATCRNGCHLTPTTGGGGLPVAAIRAQRARVHGLSVSALGARSLTLQLGDLVLGGEAENLRPAQQSAVLANTGSAVDAQLGQLAVEDQSVTLTSRSLKVPITIVSTAPYAVTATLALGSDKLLFPNGQTQWTTGVTLPAHYTRVRYVLVKTRASGVFRLVVSLHAPDGSLRLASGELTVRSTSTSVVGVVLTVGAIAVLAVWWFRTSQRRRAARRHDMAVEDPDPVDGPPEAP